MNKRSFKKLYGGSSLLENLKKNKEKNIENEQNENIEFARKLDVVNEVKQSSIIKEKIDALKNSIKNATKEARENLDEIERLNIEIYDSVIEIFKIKEESNEKYIEFLTKLKEKKIELNQELEKVDGELNETEKNIRDKSNSSSRDDDEYQSIIYDFKSREKQLKEKKHEILGKIQRIDTTCKTGEISEAELNEMLENVAEIIEISGEQKEKQGELKEVLTTVMNAMKKNFEIMNKANVNTIEQTIIDLKEFTPEVKMIKEKFFKKEENQEEESEEKPEENTGEDSEENTEKTPEENTEKNPEEKPEEKSEEKRGGSYRRKYNKKQKKTNKKQKKYKQKKKTKGGYQYSNKKNRKKSSKKSSKNIQKSSKKIVKKP